MVPASPLDMISMRSLWHARLDIRLEMVVLLNLHLSRSAADEVLNQLKWKVISEIHSIIWLLIKGHLGGLIEFRARKSKV